MLPYNLLFTVAVVQHVGAESISARHRETISYTETMVFAVTNPQPHQKFLKGFGKLFSKSFLNRVRDKVPRWGTGQSPGKR